MAVKWREAFTFPMLAYLAWSFWWHQNYGAVILVPMLLVCLMLDKERGK